MMHITIQKGNNLPDIERCTDCCSGFHCPFCDPHHFNPKMMSRLKYHLEMHFNRAVKHKEFTIHRCGRSCRADLHYHCLFCNGTVLRKRDIVKHLKSHSKHNHVISETPSANMLRTSTSHVKATAVPSSVLPPTLASTVVPRTSTTPAVATAVPSSVLPPSSASAVTTAMPSSASLPSASAFTVVPSFVLPPGAQLYIVGMDCMCSVLGCHNSTGLHSFPRSDYELSRQWVRACGLDENTKLPPQAGVCEEHFTQDAFSNWSEVKTDSTKSLLLNPNAIPTLALPKHPCPAKRLPLPQFEPERTVDIGCQTDKVPTKYRIVQVKRMPPSSSTATRGIVYCDTQTAMESPEASCTPERSPKRREEESKSNSTPSNESSNCTSKEAAQFIVDEDKLMELFERCPICSSTCEISKTRTRTRLCIKQYCAFCESSNEWFSHG